MGIAGLLQLLAPATVDVHVKAYAGKRVAVDAFSWLHKGTYACAEDLALGRPTNA
jgi:exonuclease-1